MKLATLIVLALSASALADVGPRPPRCAAEDSCVACVVGSGGENADPCAVGALDAGLARQQCTDRVGGAQTVYFCPAGKTAVRPLCSIAPGWLGLALVTLWVLGRRRR